jgi:hypothetical protein
MASVQISFQTRLEFRPFRFFYDIIKDLDLSFKVRKKSGIFLAPRFSHHLLPEDSKISMGLKSVLTGFIKTEKINKTGQNQFKFKFQNLGIFFSKITINQSKMSVYRSKISTRMRRGGGGAAHPEMACWSLLIDHGSRPLLDWMLG